jgi:hypothetical protein
MDMLARLVALLSSGAMDAAQSAVCADRIRGAVDDPDYAWADGPATAMTLELLLCLDDDVASGDKIDEVHELLSDMFETPLPDFHTLWPRKADFTWAAYHTWMDQELARRAPDRGGYDLVSIDDGVSEDMHLVITLRPDTAEILKLGDALGLRITRAQADRA